MIELTGEDLVKIIKACKAAGVRKFELGELKIDFSAPNEEMCSPPISIPHVSVDPSMAQNWDSGQFTYAGAPMDTPVEQDGPSLTDLDADDDDDLLLITNPTRWHEESLKSSQSKVTDGDD